MATILVIEDDDLMRSAIATCLHHCGHTVITARNGREGLEHHAVGTGVFDLVVCDLLMPDVGGVQTMRTLHTRDAHLPILVISGATHALAYVRRCDMAPAHACLAKPFTLTQLSEAVERLLSDAVVAI
jgi:DNA-binding NtrC family response regulator